MLGQGEEDEDEIINYKPDNEIIENNIFSEDSLNKTDEQLLEEFSMFGDIFD